MLTSGKSGWSRARTAPMVIRAGAGPAFTRRGSRRRAGAGVEHQPELADLHLVAGLQGSLVDALTVDIGAVERPDVTDEEPVALASEAGVLARDRDVVQEDVAVGVAPGADLVGVEEEPGSRVGSAQDDQECGPGPQRVHGGLVGTGQVSGNIGNRIHRRLAPAPEPPSRGV